MFCSVIIPTIGRPTLRKAVYSLLSQQFTAESFEIIVVNDSGKPLHTAQWQQDEKVRIIETNKRKLCAARNTGAAVAKGRYLLFLDDDDWLLPDALTQFWKTAQKHPEAACISGRFELVNDIGEVISRHGLAYQGNCSVQLVTGTWLQVASVLVQADVFFEYGGFSPLFLVSEEIDLWNRISLQREFVSCNVVVAQILRGRGWQTTVDYSIVYEYNRKARDNALAQAGAYHRLSQSAVSSYWKGRLFRLYSTSMIWNWRRQKRFFTGLSRGLYALASLLSSSLHLITKDFWRAVRDDVPQR